MTHDNTTNNAPNEAVYYAQPFDELEQKLAEVETITSPAQAAAMNDLIKEIQGLAKKADQSRVELKRPYMEAANLVQSSFNVIRDRAADLVKRGKGLLTPYLVEQKRIADEAERKAREEAEEKARVAAALADDAIVGEMVVEEAQQAASAANLALVDKDIAGRAGSASGMARTASLRTYYDAVITDPQAAAAHYAVHPAIQDAIIKVAEAAMRSDKHKATVIPGITFNQRQEVA